MVTRMVLSLILLINTAQQIASANNENLVAVVQIFRHGQRTPIEFYPNDPYSNITTYWGGLEPATLTNKGKHQHYLLGQFTRNRYADWLPSTDHNNFIYAQTTDMDRTRISAQYNLYGLFPSMRNTLEAIPIHLSDPRVISPYTPCPTYRKLTTRLLAASEYTYLDLFYADLFAYVSDYMGTNLTTWTQIIYLYDTLLIEDQVGLPLLAWTAQIYPQPAGSLITKYHELFSKTTQLKRLAIGLWFNEVIEYFESILQDSTLKPKYRMYSGHDVNIASILNTIGQFNLIYPTPFAASIWFELRRVNWDHVVNVWYKENDSFKQLRIHDCDLECPLSTMKTILKDILLDLDTWTRECI